MVKKRPLRKSRGVWVHGTADCGCCPAVLWYRTRERAEAAITYAAGHITELRDDRKRAISVDGNCPFTCEDHP